MPSTLTEEEGQLLLPAESRWIQSALLRKQGDDLIVDDKLSYGQRVVPQDNANAIEIDGKMLESRGATLVPRPHARKTGTA